MGPADARSAMVGNEVTTWGSDRLPPATCCSFRDSSRPQGAYRQLLAPVAAAGTAVTVPQLYRPSPAVLMERFTTNDEAQAAVALTRNGLGDGGAQVFLGGHSRGGQAAWLAAQQLRKQGIQN